MPTVYVKIPQLRAVIDQPEVSCEEKLEQIKKLADGKKLSLLQPGQSPAVSGSAEQSVPSTGNPEHVDRILNEVKGVKEKQLAQVILQEIEKSDYISYDVTNWEIIVANERIKFTNVIYLINFIIAASPSSIPLGLAIFLHALMKIQAPFDVVRNGDAVNCRDNLIKISELTKDRNEPQQNVESVSMAEDGDSGEQTIVEMGNGGGDEVSDGLGSAGKKRSREDEDGDGGDLTDRPAKRSFGLGEKPLEGIRRSPRLRQKISEAWTSKSKRKNGKGDKK